MIARGLQPRDIDAELVLELSEPGRSDSREEDADELFDGRSTEVERVHEGRGVGRPSEVARWDPELRNIRLGGLLEVKGRFREREKEDVGANVDLRNASDGDDGLVERLVVRVGQLVPLLRI